MSSDDVRYRSDLDFSRILNIVRTRQFIEKGLEASRPVCTSSGASQSSTVFNFCKQEFYTSPEIQYDYASYSIEDSNLAKQPDEVRIEKLFAAVIPVLVYLGSASTKKLSGYTSAINSIYGEVSASADVKKAVGSGNTLGQFTENAYFSFWYFLHPKVRQQILDVVAALSSNLGVDPACARRADAGDLDSCRSTKARTLLRVVNALRKTSQNQTLDQIKQGLVPDINISRPTNKPTRSRNRRQKA